MTPVGSTRFVGRLKEMWEVHSLLHAGDVAQITGAAAATGGIGQVQGLGGVGKSLLAEEYALHFGAAYPGGVFWLRAYGNDDAKAVLGATEREALRGDQMRQMAERVGINTQGLTPAQIERLVARNIERGGQPCLWIVDDVPGGLDGQTLRPWFAPHSLARTLVTTRSREYGALAKGIDLSVLTPDEAYQLLTSRRKPASKDEEEQACELAKDLGYHALALDVTGSALVFFGFAQPFAEFRAELARRDEDALELAKDLADALPNGHEKSIAKTLLRSILALGPEGRDFLRLASVLAVAPIPALLVKDVFERVDHISRWDAQWRVAQAFQQATNASLAEVAGGAGEARSVHTLISRTMRFHEKAAPGRARALRVIAIEVLSAEIAKAADDPRLHKQIEFHATHARQVVTMPENVAEANLLNSVARYDNVRGSYASARALYERVLEFFRVLGPEHPNTLASMGNLAVTLSAQGDLPGARRLEEDVFSTVRRVLGPEHPNTLASMNNLADTMRAQGELAGARKLQEEVLTVLRRVQGPEHQDTLKSMNNLAYTLQGQGDLVGARKLLEDALVISRRVLGSHHTETLVTMSNLGVTLRIQGDMAEERKLQEEALTTLRGILGREHPRTLIATGVLGVTLQALGDLPRAQELLVEVLGVSRRVLGPEHPDTLTATNNLAQILHAQGDLPGARALQEETLAVNRRRLGPEHPDTLTSMSNLAGTLTSQGDLARAGELLEEALDLCRRMLGPDHPQTLNTMNNLAGTLHGAGDLRGSCKLSEAALEIQRRTLGPEHPNTSNSARNLFRILHDLGDEEAARAVLEHDLLWLLERDPATLGAQQREIRQQVAEIVNKTE